MSQEITKGIDINDNESQTLEIPLIISSKNNKCSTICTPWGTLTFRKDNDNININNHVIFGRSMMIFLPPHGDINCNCKDCTLYRLVQEEKSKGYTCTKFELREK